VRWKIERSDDGVEWKESASFFWADLAQRAFDLELVLRKAKYVRLLAPDGRVQERACPGKLQKRDP